MAYDRTPPCFIVSSKNDLKFSFQHIRLMRGICEKISLKESFETIFDIFSLLLIFLFLGWLVLLIAKIRILR